MAKIDFRRLGFDFFPGGAAQPVEGRLRAVAADVFLHHVDAVHRQIKPVARFIFEMEKLALDTGDLEKFKAAINADAMVQMDDVIVLLELAQAGKKMARMALRRRGRLALPRAEDFIEGHQNQMRFGQAKPLVQMAADDRTREILARQQCGERLPRPAAHRVRSSPNSSRKPHGIALGRRDEE